MMQILDLGIIDFQSAYELQDRLVEEIFHGREKETLLLLEHPPVYTIGRGGDERNVLDEFVRPVRINRGGDVTYHGPGQLVGYPIIDLGARGRDLHRYLRFLEELLIAVAAGFGVEAFRVAGKTGVWTVRGKLASIGVGVRRWMTMHGFALNVSADLEPFRSINPCGIADCPVTSLAELTGLFLTVGEVKAAIGGCFDTLLRECLPLRPEVTQDDAAGIK